MPSSPSSRSHPPPETEEEDLIRGDVGDRSSKGNSAQTHRGSIFQVKKKKNQTKKEHSTHREEEKASCL